MAASACSLYLLLISVTCLKNARLECLLCDKWDVSRVKSALLWVVDVMAANVGLLNGGVAC